MLRLRTLLALLLLFSVAASAQEDLETAVSAVVRISGTKDGSPVRGSGFVVGLDRDKATIMTASHVIEGVQQLEVTFAADLTERFPASVLGLEAGNPNGLAALQVRGAPAGVTTLSFEIASRPRIGDALFLLGFPQMAPAPRTTQRVLSARSGTLLLVDQDVGEGFSGGPVLEASKVVGVITGVDDQTTYAVEAVVVKAALVGWKVTLGSVSLPLPTTGTCVPDQEAIENGILFVRICPGTFTMGADDPLSHENERPVHQVTLSEFWIGKTEITNEQYRSYQPSHKGEAGVPVTHVSWDDAHAACKHFGGRLPTEAEWEYAVGIGRQIAEPFSKSQSNAWEWVEDWYGPYSRGSLINPTGPKQGEDHVLRAASDLPLWGIRLPRRARGQFELQPQGIGFRCVRTPRRQS